jgi:hypothetical protein
MLQFLKNSVYSQHFGELIYCKKQALPLIKFPEAAPEQSTWQKILCCALGYGGWDRKAVPLGISCLYLLGRGKLTFWVWEGPSDRNHRT